MMRVLTFACELCGHIHGPLGEVLNPYFDIARFRCSEVNQQLHRECLDRRREKLKDRSIYPARYANKAIAEIDRQETILLKEMRDGRGQT